VRIAGHGRSVRDGDDQRWIIEAPVGIDQQAREGGEQGRDAERARAGAGHGRRADVVGDVARQLRGRQAEVPVSGQDGVRGVVAQQQQPAAEIARDGLDGCGRERDSGSACGHPAKNLKLIGRLPDRTEDAGCGLCSVRLL
jgi:hypothetical protein